MIKDGINYLNVKLDALGYFNTILCLVEKIEREGKVYPAQYNTSGEYQEINLDPNGSLSYWRKNGDVSISDQPNETSASSIQYQTTVPLKLVCFIKKDAYSDDQYFADNLCSEIISYLTTNNAALKTAFKAKKATVIASKYVTDSRSVGAGEYDNVNFEARYTHAYFSIDFDLVFITNNQCYTDICSDLPIDFGYVTVTDGETITKVKCGQTYTCEGGGGGSATVENSDASYQSSVAAGDTLVLADITYDVYVNSVLNASGTLPSMVNNVINIS